MRIFIFLLFILFALKSNGQTIISGVVKSGNTTIVGANIFIKDTYEGISSDANGKFKFTSEQKGTKTLLVTFVGYENCEQEILIGTTALLLNINLKEKANELNTVTISAGTFESSDSKKAVLLTALDIATTAGAVADIYAALQTLPGAQAASEEEGLQIRGGAASETKTYYDGMLVQKPFLNDLPNIAQRGRFSPFEFKGTTFAAGGYSAVYGQALSSTLQLESKDVAEKTSSDISIMSVGGSLGHTHRFKNSSINVNGSYINLAPMNALIKQNIDWQHDPSAVSMASTYRLKLSPTGLLKAYTEYSSNSTSFNYKDIEQVNNESYLKNVDKASYSNITYQEMIAPKWKLNAGMSINLEGNKVNLDSDLVIRNDGMVHNRLMLTNYVGTLSSIKIGGEYSKQFKEESFNNQDRNFVDELFSGFAEGDIYLSKDLVARLGLRVENSSLLNKTAISPRGSLAYKTGKQTQVSIAVGSFYQNPVDNILIINSKLSFEAATHLILNYQYTNEKYTFRIEGYNKQYSSLVSYQTGFVNMNNNGKGYARGIDIFWRDKKSIRMGDYWVSYSFIDSKRAYKDYPYAVQPGFIATHTLNVVYKKYIPKITTQIAATYTLASGRPYNDPNSNTFFGERTKTYHNLSVNASYLTSIKDHFTILFISVGNLTGYKNIYGYQYSSDGSRRNPIEPSALRSVFVGLFISIGDDSIIN